MADETELLRHNQHEEEEEQEDADLKKPGMVIIQESESRPKPESPVDEPAPPSPHKTPAPESPKREKTPVITVDEPSTRIETTETEELVSAENAPLIQVRVHEEVREERVVKFAATPSPQEKDAEVKKEKKKKGLFGKSAKPEAPAENEAKPKSKPKVEETKKKEEPKKKERSASPLKKDAEIALANIPRTISETKIPRNLFVMTMNSWGMGKNVAQGFGKLVQHIKVIDPDILALQEVTSKREFQKLLQALGPDWTGYCRYSNVCLKIYSS